MTDDLRTAFGHPLARAEALAGPDPLDRISLRDHVVKAQIGAFEAEQGVWQRLRFDIVVEVRPLGDAGDDVDRILSYDKLTEAVADEVIAERLNLLETLAQRIAMRILREPQAERVFLRVEKLDRGPGDLGVEIVRSRQDATPADEAAEALRPLVVLLADHVIRSPELPALLERLIAEGQPLLLCVESPDLPTPEALSDEAKARIRLLALDQNAWSLGSQDPRLVVASSRTEIDWALRRGYPCVWAPSRIALGTVRLRRIETDSFHLAFRLSEELGAMEFRPIGVAWESLRP